MKKVFYIISAIIICAIILMTFAGGGQTVPVKVSYEFGIKQVLLTGAELVIKNIGGVQLDGITVVVVDKDGVEMLRQYLESLKPGEKKVLMRGMYTTGRIMNRTDRVFVSKDGYKTLEVTNLE